MEGATRVLLQLFESISAQSLGVRVGWPKRNSVADQNTIVRMQCGRVAPKLGCFFGKNTGFPVFTSGSFLNKLIETGPEGFCFLIFQIIYLAKFYAGGKYEGSI